jgi:hypothetical protein
MVSVEDEEKQTPVSLKVNFSGVGSLAPHPTLIWRTRTFDLFAMTGPTRILHSCKHSSPGHWWHKPRLHDKAEVLEESWHTFRHYPSISKKWTKGNYIIPVFARIGQRKTTYTGWFPQLEIWTRTSKIQRSIVY